MNNLRSPALLCVLALTMNNPAHGGIYSANDPAIVPLAGHSVAGTGNITVDPVTGFAWLDTTLSVGLSYNDVVAGLVPGGAFSGYRLATNAEVTGFWRDAGIPVPFGGEGLPGEPLQSRWGITTGFATNVFTSTPFPPTPDLASVLQIIDKPSDWADTATATPQFGVALDQADPGIAAALVRVISPPLSEVIFSGYDPNIRSLPNHPAMGPGNVTVDAITNLRWLDSAHTIGLSHADVAAELGPGGAFAGYRFARNDEVLALWQHAGVLPLTTTDSPEVASLMRLMGYVSNFQRDLKYHTCMFTADQTKAPPGYDVMHMAEDWDSRNRYYGEVAEIISPAANQWCWSGNTGVALVQQVPEPSTLALAAFGILGLLIVARHSA